MIVNFIATEVNLPNWIAILGGVFLLFCLTLAIYNEFTLDSDLTDAGKFNEIKSQFANEFNKLKLPPQTVVYKTENKSKPRFAVRLNTRYRTELNEYEFVKDLRSQLEKNGWIYYGSNREHPFVRTEIFCRGKFDAKLSKESWSIWKDDAEYYQLNFTFGHRDLIKSNGILPENCK